MRKVDIWIKGFTPLLMNSNVGVNPTHPLTKEMKSITDKRKKTDEDNERILRLKWELGLYLEDEKPCIPAINVEACIRDAAKIERKGKDTVASIIVTPFEIPLIYDGPHDKEALWDDPRFRDVQVGRIQRGSVLLCRPRFSNWQLKFSLEYDENVFDREMIKRFLTTAGMRIGLCDYRPRYGKFTLMSMENAK
jgi:hypothetical protein